MKALRERRRMFKRIERTHKEAKIQARKGSKRKTALRKLFNKEQEKKIRKKKEGEGRRYEK